MTAYARLRTDQQSVSAYPQAVRGGKTSRLFMSREGVLVWLRANKYGASFRRGSTDRAARSDWRTHKEFRR